MPNVTLQREQPWAAASPPVGTARVQDGIALGALFVSGSAALVYQICWIRKASLIFGSTTFAVSTVFAVFFLGLAVGSCLFGRLAVRVQRPLWLFAGLEVCIGLLALATPILFHWADMVYGMIYRTAPETQWLLGVARAGLVGLAIAPAATLMGGSLPLFCRRYATARSPVSRSVGALYGLNTLGAAAGAAAAGFLMLPSLGLSLTLQTAAGLSFVCALAVALLPMSRRAVGTATEELAAGMAAPTSRKGSADILVRLWGVLRRGQTGMSALPAGWFPLLLYFGVGLVALGLEVVWFRFLSLIIRNTVTTYTLVVTVVLVGIVLGSWLAAWLLSKEARCARIFGTLQILSGLTVIGLMSLPAGLWRAVESEVWVCALLLLIPAVLGGASFPPAVRLVTGNPSAAPVGAGLALAANTLGGVLGALLTGFVLLPYLGLQWAVWLASGLSLMIGSAAWLWLDGTDQESAVKSRRSKADRPSRDLVVLRARGLLQPRLALAVMGAWGVWLGVAMLGTTRLPADYLAEPGGALVGYREGFGANLAVIEQDGVKRLEIDRWWQGEDRKNHQALSAHIPSLLHPEPRSVLLVGVGAGQTASRFLMHDIARLDCVDIEPMMFDFVAQHFGSAWMADERTRLIIEDGRSYLRHGWGRYDIISLELGQVFRPGVAYFYTREAYEFARRRLEPGGLLVQFVPLPFFSLEQFEAVVGTFLEVFPQSVLWYNTAEILLIGSNAPEFPWRTDLAPAPPWSLAVGDDLELAYWGGPAQALNRPEVFLGGFLLGPDDLARLAAPQRRLRDDLPVLDYATARVHQLQTNEIAIAEALREHVSTLGAALGIELDPAFQERVSVIQARNLGDISAAALLRQAKAFEERGNGAKAVSALVEALRWNDKNAEANLRLGDLLLRHHQPAQALDYFEAAARIRPDDVQALHGLGICLHRTGRMAASIEYYRRTLRLDPVNAEVHNNLGAALGEQGRFQEALGHLEEAIRLRPGYGEAERNLAVLEQARSRSAESESIEE